MKTCKLYRNLNKSPLGGGVVHSITLSEYKGKYSAYYDSDGKMIDAENQGRNVPKNSPLWRKLEIESGALFRICAKRGEDS